MFTNPRRNNLDLPKGHIEISISSISQHLLLALPQMLNQKSVIEIASLVRNRERKCPIELPPPSLRLQLGSPFATVNKTNNEAG